MALIECSECGKQVSDKASACPSCGCPINENVGVMKYHVFSAPNQVKCPKCGSINCSNHKETIVIPAKTKTRYTANLNPLKPFTIANKKEKVIRNESSYDINKFICNKCGKIFKG